MPRIWIFFFFFKSLGRAINKIRTNRKFTKPRRDNFLCIQSGILPRFVEKRGSFFLSLKFYFEIPDSLAK